MLIKDNVYLLEASKGSYVYLIRGEEGILIDTGLPFRRGMILKELKRMNVEPGEIRHILLTHHDIDHIGNLEVLQQLTGADIWASAEDIPFIYGDRERPSFKRYLKHLFKTDIPRVIKPYEKDQSIEGVTVIPTPGHTPGHVCLLYNDILFAGDLVKNKRGTLGPFPGPWNWDSGLASDSVEKMSGISVKWVCPAHGLPLEGDFRSLIKEK